MEAAACRGLEPEVADAYFFPERGQSAARAREFCQRCVVRAECLEQALSEPEEFGVLGRPLAARAWQCETITAESQEQSAPLICSPESNSQPIMLP